MKHSTQNSHII